MPQLLAPYNTKEPEKAEMMVLFSVYNSNTTAEISKNIKNAPNPKWKLIICTVKPDENALRTTLGELGFVELKPEVLRVPSYYNGTKVQVWVLSRKNWKS